MPRTEPNSLPPVYLDWPEWRIAYSCYAEEYRDSVKAHPEARATYEVRLRNRLSRLGFTGHDLESEMTYIRTGGV